MDEIVLKGIPAASGIAYGPSFILDKGEFIVPKRLISPLRKWIQKLPVLKSLLIMPSRKSTL